jgi:hypothetical protein
MAGQEVTFRIKKSTLGRVGWRIMPEDDYLKQNILNQVLEKIR